MDIDNDGEDYLPPLKREFRNPYNVAAQALGPAYDFWLWLYKKVPNPKIENPEEYFWDEFFGKTFNDPSTDGDQAVEKLGTLSVDGFAAEEGKAPFALLEVMGIIVDYAVQAMTSEKNGNHEIAWSYASDAQYWAGILRANLAEKSEPSQLSSNAIKAALKRWELDPKRLEKNFVYDCWLSWQESKGRYSGKAAFARDMLSKCEHLTSQAKIEQWCRDWEKRTLHAE
jgi:hypothetical protein